MIGHCCTIEHVTAALQHALVSRVSLCHLPVGLGSLGLTLLSLALVKAARSLALVKAAKGQLWACKLATKRTSLTR